MPSTADANTSGGSTRTLCALDNYDFEKSVKATLGTTREPSRAT